MPLKTARRMVGWMIGGGLGERRMKRGQRPKMTLGEVLQHFLMTPEERKLKARYAFASWRRQQMEERAARQQQGGQGSGRR